MTKKSRQKLKYLANEKSFYDETKSIFHHFCRAIIKANKISFGKVRAQLEVYLKNWLNLGLMRISNINKQNTAAMRKHWCSSYHQKTILHHHWTNIQKDVTRIMDNKQVLTKSGLTSSTFPSVTFEPSMFLLRKLKITFYKLLKLSS